MINEGWARLDYVVGYESPVDGRTVYVTRYDPVTWEWLESDCSFTRALGNVSMSKAVELASMLKMPFLDVQLKVFERIVKRTTVFEVENER